MPFQVVRSPERALQQQMLLYEMLRKDRAAREDAATAQARWEENQARLQAGTQADIEEGLARTAQGQGRLDLETWKAGTEYTREEAKTAAEVGLRGAQTEEARARTGLVHEQTAGEIEDNTRKQNTDLVDRARRQVTAANAQMINGLPLDRDATDVYEKGLRTTSGNPELILPRNPDGSLAGDPKQWTRAYVDDKGNPSAKFAGEVRDLSKPYGEFGQLIADGEEARAAGAPPEVLKNYSDKIWKEVAPSSVNQVEGTIVKTLLDDGNFEGAMDAITQMRAAPAKATAAGKAGQARIENSGKQLQMVADIDDIQKDYDTLVKSGRLPVGALKQPLLDAWKFLGNDDPYVSAFHKKLDSFKARYLLYLSGRAATDSERNDVKYQVPSRWDSMQTFSRALPNFRDKVTRDIAIDNGISKMYGLPTIQGFPVVDPVSVIKKDGHLPNWVTATGIIDHTEMEAHAQGISSLGDSFRRAQSRIGGVSEFRNYAAPEAAEAATRLDPNGMSEAPDVYTDPERAAALMKRKQEILDKLQGGE